MNKKLITIMTPTYNRANTMSRLYKSIKQQADDDVEWLIIDDGSTDNTQEIVNEFIKESNFEIKYIRQDNGGKYKAFNAGVDAASGAIYFCVDSDDILSDGAIDSVKNAWKVIRNKNNVAGIVALKEDFCGNRLSDDLPDGIYDTLYNIVNSRQISGEFCVLYKTEILKRYKFPDVSPEKFVGECVLYDSIDKHYVLLALNKVLNSCEYQSDGITAMFVKTMIENPTGYKIYHMQRIDMALNIKTRILHIIKYHAFGLLSNDSKYNYNGKHKAIVAIMYPLGFIAKLIYKKKV